MPTPSINVLNLGRLEQTLDQIRRCYVILGGAIANNILNASKVHPNHTERPLIDWDLILQLEPMTIGGALIGACV